MRWLERLLYAGFPALRLHGTPWLSLWREREQRTLRVVTRVSLILTAVTLVLHHFFVDVPLGLEPRTRWMAYRFGVAAFLLVMASTTFTSTRSSTWPRLPLGLCGMVVSYFQAKSMTWYDGVPYWYAVFIPCIITLLLQDSLVKSAGYLLATYMLQWPSIAAARVDHIQVVSAALVGYLVVIMFRSRMAAEIAWFISEQEKTEAQKQLIQSQIELNEEIRAFLPREIYERLVRSRYNRKTTVLQAMDEALRPKLLTVACIFSDVRGFTQQSKDLSGFVLQRALPNIRICTQLVESFRGIPRLVGDLVFAYFDSGVPTSNILDAIACGIALVERNAEWNRAVSEQEQVRRFVLLSFGEAIVGNIGGTDASREITALGSCVNILARIDPLTKAPALVPHLSSKSLILTRQAAEAVRFCLPDVALERIDLDELELQIRDFPEEKAIFLLPVDDRHKKLVTGKHSSLETDAALLLASSSSSPRSPAA